MLRGSRTFAALLLCTGVLVACSSSSDESAATPAPSTPVTEVSPPAPTDPPATDPPATDPPATDPVAAVGFRKVTPGGDCECADGSEFSFWVREADPTKVLFFFQGGGACFSADTCSFTNGTYKVTTGDSDNPDQGSGIFDFDDQRNPLADYSVVFVPYCTGDVHIGNTDTTYSAGLTVSHRGYVNGNAALDELVKSFPDAAEVVVAGESAGSIPTPLYAGLVRDRLPNAAITVLADGSGAYPDIPVVNSTIGTQWGTGNAIPDWPENAGLTAEQWSLPGLFVQAGKHAPEIVFARHDYAFDRTQEQFAALAGVPADELVSLIDANETQIEASGIDLFSYISSGKQHTVLGGPGFYTEELNGVLLHEWVTDLINGVTVGDVHCTECTG